MVGGIRLSSCGRPGRRDPHQQREHAPQVVQILGFLAGERQPEAAHAVDQEPREPHDGGQHVLVVDRDPEAPDVVRPVFAGQHAHPGVQQPQLLRRDDGAAVRLERIGVRDVDQQLHDAHQPAERVALQVARNRQDFADARRRVAARQARGEQHHYRRQGVAEEGGAAAGQAPDVQVRWQPRRGCHEGRERRRRVGWQRRIVGREQLEDLTDGGEPAIRHQPGDRGIGSRIAGSAECVEKRSVRPAAVRHSFVARGGASVGVIHATRRISDLRLLIFTRCPMILVAPRPSPRPAN